MLLLLMMLSQCKTEKGQSPPPKQPKTLPQAVEKVRFCKEILTEYENSVRSVEGCSKVTLNGF